MLPEEFKNRMKDMLGRDYGDLAACYEKPPVKSLRLNRRKVLPVDFARMSRILTGSDSPDSVSIWPGAYYYEDAEPGKSPLHEAGACYIQEASAMLPATLIDADDSGMAVLDLCAAPGGKTTQIADLMNGRGIIVANEIIGSRASVLSENVERMGVGNALIISETPDRLAERFPASFDRIMVDAPCSGEGMFRKNPEAVNEWGVENVKMCASRQDCILDCAAKMLAPGGKLVYSTCTFSPEEDEECVSRFLSRHPEFRVCDEPHRLYPHTFRGEGHFAVSFVNAGNPCAPGECFPDAVIKKTSGKSFDTALVSSFLEETLVPGPVSQIVSDHPERLVEFGDSLYIVPAHMPDIKGLIVYRAGIKLGSFKKNRFEPDHALSHVLGMDDVRCYVNYPSDSPEVRQYLSGMTLTCDRAMKGWCLVCTDGFPLGWAKATGGVLKNHYPKGLRK